MINSDMLGKRFNRLKVISHGDKSKDGKARVTCECDCGTTKTFDAWAVRSGNTRSCGCLAAELAASRKRTHGMRKTSTYRSWEAMKRRCSSTNSNRFYNYGARGIAVCERWMDFDNFLADMGEKPDGMSIERINNNEGYYPENCRWATTREQARNTQNTIFIAHGGLRLCIADWATRLGISRSTIQYRYKRGLDAARCLSLANLKKARP